MKRVLYVGHSHMTIRVGGAQAYASELCQAVRERGEFEPLFVCRSGPPQSKFARHAGTRLASGDSEPNLYYFHTERSEFDMMPTATDKRMYTEDWRAFLDATKPDIVHFHHHLGFGYDVLRETRRTLPDAVIVYTLHDFHSICRNEGQMVRTQAYELCAESSPRRCHECFPNIPAPTFFLRKRFIDSAFDLVDMFVAPSEQLRRRYVEWGIPPAKIIHEEYGRNPVVALPDPPDAGRRRRIGYFGQITSYKGVDVLLEAMKLLERDEVDVHLTVWAANLDIQSPDLQERIGRLLEETAESVRLAGPYDQAAQPRLMSSVDWVVVPSIWWENAPLVIDEAMMHRRPVICSGIGGMAEKVRDGVDGLHFRVHDPESLAEVIRRAVDSPELWDRLRRGITDPHPMHEHLDVLARIYGEEPGPRGSRAMRARAKRDVSTSQAAGRSLAARL